MRRLMCLTPALLLVPAAQARELSTAVFANAFAEGQAVQLQAAAGEPATIVLRDLAGRDVARREAPGVGPVDFGPLAPGYYEAVCGETVLPLAVVIGPARRVVGPSRLATDHAMSWLTPAAQHEPLAALLKLCGVQQVRERLSWGEVAKEPGTLVWEGRYESSLDALASRQIGVFDVFHGVPGWSRADKDGKAACDDLRVIHEFARSLAERWRGKVQAWEVWNEPDISFFSHPACEMAAFQKAAFLGFESVDGGPTVLGPSMAHGVCAFSDGLLDNGVADYLDIWNYHIYADPSAYAGRAADWRRSLAAYGVDKPLWVTEAGDRVPGPEGVLTADSQRHQAAFVSRAFAQAMAAGVDRHYWFIFPFYREQTIGWGLLGPGNRYPFPGLPAFATATWALGAGDYLGRLPNLPDDVRAVALGRGDGTACLVVWREADLPAPVSLPLDWAQVTDATDHLGTPLARGTGAVTVEVGRAAVYLIAPQAVLAGPAVPPPLREVVTPRPAPGLPQVVVRVQVTAEVDKDADAYRAKAGQTVPVTVQLYNFGQTTVAGRLRLSSDVLQIAQPDRAVDLPAGQRVELPAEVTVPASHRRAALRAVVESGTATSSPAVVPFAVDANELVAVATQPLGLDEPGKWRTNIAGHGTMTIEPGADGGVKFGFAFQGAGDPWAYPQTIIDPPLDASRYEGVRFEYRTNVEEVGVVRFMAVEAGGPAYMTSAGFPGSITWRQATVPFEALTPMGSLPPGHGRGIQTDRLAVLRVGANCKPAEVTLEVRSLRLVRWTQE